MNYFLDTNIIIYAIKNTYPNLVKKFEETPSYNIVVPAIVKAELEYGASKSANYKKTIDLYNKFINIYNIISFTDKETIFYGNIRTELERKGTLIGANDMLIAATVLSHNGVLVTHNVKEFSRISNFKIEDWTKAD